MTEAIPAAPSSEWNEACKLMLQRSVMQLAESLIRPHRSTAAYCYRPSSMVCQTVCHSSEPCKNGSIDRNSVWLEDSGGPSRQVLRDAAMVTNFGTQFAITSFLAFDAL